MYSLLYVNYTSIKLSKKVNSKGITWKINLWLFSTNCTQLITEVLWSKSTLLCMDKNIKIILYKTKFFLQQRYMQKQMKLIVHIHNIFYILMVICRFLCFLDKWTTSRKSILENEQSYLDLCKGSFITSNIKKANILRK